MIEPIRTEAKVTLPVIMAEVICGSIKIFILQRAVGPKSKKMRGSIWEVDFQAVLSFRRTQCLSFWTEKVG